jgi:hypothetical protein
LRPNAEPADLVQPGQGESRRLEQRGDDGKDQTDVQADVIAAVDDQTEGNKQGNRGGRERHERRRRLLIQHPRRGHARREK